MSSQQGLTSAEVKKRIKKFGRNELKRTHKIHPVKIFISQFTSPLILILIFAALVSWGVGFLPEHQSSYVDSILILIIVLISGIAGFFQEYKSEKTIEALQNMTIPKAKVIRDGKEMEMEITEIVPGDIVKVESGDIVPADSKLIECYGIKVDESILTGESRAVKKKSSEMIFMNTFISDGSATALVLNTGMQTKVGTIAKKLEEIKEYPSPFQQEISIFSKKIFFVILGIIVIIMAISLIKYDLYTSLFMSISLAVAAIPEGLPAVVIVTLASAARVMSRKKALIRKLAVTESLGAVNIICTDKTGTLTKNEMSVTKIFFNNTVFFMSKINKKNAKSLKPLFLCGSFCNNAIMGIDEKNKKKYLGDQTEIAIRKISDDLGFSKETIEKGHQRIDEISFSSKRKMMSVVWKREGSKKFLVYTKGATEILLEKCDRILQSGKIAKLTQKDKKIILEQNKEFASQALRVLGFAYKETDSPKKGTEKNLIWIGLEAMIDPPRNEAKASLKKCESAGIRVIMLTGDNAETAQAIAHEIELESTGVITGKDMDKMSDNKLEKNLNTGINIFARISPFHKLRIFEILGKHNMVAMTGDGVNDALALKKSDVGIAMGIKGTEVAKQASDMILLDDNFATITVAIKEGRRIFENIRKFINYLFVCNMAEVGVLFLSTIFIALDQPILLPVQLLWINLLTDGLPALALGVDPARPNIMKEPPRKKGEPIVNKTLWILIGAIGSNMIIVLLAVFLILLPMGVDTARTGLFTGFILYEFVRIASIRYQEKLKWFSNPLLVMALIGSVILQLIIVYTPLNKYFQIVPLGTYEWIILLTGTMIAYISAIIITNTVIKHNKVYAN